MSETLRPNQQEKSIATIIIQKDKKAAIKMLKKIAEMQQGQGDDAEVLEEYKIISSLADLEYPSGALVKLAQIAGQREESDHLTPEEMKSFCDITGSGEFLVRCANHVAFCHNCGIDQEEAADKARTELAASVDRTCDFVKEVLSGDKIPKA